MQIQGDEVEVKFDGLSEEYNITAPSHLVRQRLAPGSGKLTNCHNQISSFSVEPRSYHNSLLPNRRNGQAGTEDKAMMTGPMLRPGCMRWVVNTVF